VQKVIEHSTAFVNGEIVICKDMHEANTRSRAKDLQKVISSGMVTMTDETGRIASVEEAQAAIATDEGANNRCKPIP